MTDETPRLTRIGAVVDALVALAGEVLDGVTVVDGVFLGQLGERVLVVGLPSGPDAGYNTKVARQRGLGVPRLTEEFTVRCLLNVSTGSNFVAQLRTDVAGMITALDGALRDRARNSGVWDTASLGGTMRWFPIQGADGAGFSVIFDVVGTSLL